MDNLAIVEFISENSVAVIPNEWISEDEQALKCYWPSNKVSQHIKRQEMPDIEKWKTYDIKLIAQTGTLGVIRRTVMAVMFIFLLR